MIEINLLPVELRKKESYISKINLSGLDLKNLPYLKIAAVAAVVPVAIPAILLIIGIIANSQISSLTKKYNEILPMKEEADRLRIEVEYVRRKVVAIDLLMVKRLLWSKRMNDLSDAMTPGVWLSELTYDEKVIERPIKQAPQAATPKEKDALEELAGPKKIQTEKMLRRSIVISGYAVGTSEEGTSMVGKFIKALKSHKGFFEDLKDIDLESIRRDRVQDQEVMNFKIICLFKDSK